MKISERLYELRRKAGLSQEELAEKIGVSRQAVGKWENGASVPELEKLLSLSEFYGIGIGELIGAEPPSAVPPPPSEPEDAPVQESSGPDPAALEDLLQSLGENQRAGNLRAKKQRKYLWCALAAVLGATIVVTVVLFVRLADLQSRLSSLNSLLVFTQNSLSDSITRMQSSVAGLLEEQYSLFTSLDYTLSLDEDSGSILVTITAVPKTLTDTTDIRFTVHRGKESFSAEGIIEDGVCKAELLIPPSTLAPGSGTDLTLALRLYESSGNGGIPEYNLDYSAYGSWLTPATDALPLTVYFTDGGAVTQRDVGSIVVGLDEILPSRRLNWYSGSAQDGSVTGLLVMKGDSGSVTSARVIVYSGLQKLYDQDLALSWDEHFALPEEYLHGPTFSTADGQAALVRPAGDLGGAYSQELTLDFSDAAEGDRLLAFLELTDEHGIKYLGILFTGRPREESDLTLRDFTHVLRPVLDAEN